jgi:hypothetical protein
MAFMHFMVKLLTLLSISAKKFTMKCMKTMKDRPPDRMSPATPFLPV